MTRLELAEKIKLAKAKKGVSWADIAKKVGRSEVWTTAALLGQMTMDPKEANAAAKVLSLSKDEEFLLTQIPYKGSLPAAVPTDALIYRFYEVVSVYGTTFKAVIEDKFGEGIMSAIDFSCDIERVPDPKGDRVKVTMNGKFLPYKKY
ncbi:MAG TPA: cyanase [Alphaproteobacteria bacterium]|jgi:cyanate lyase|nr:cyanase [Alphaproteobacteria bacterium]